MPKMFQQEYDEYLSKGGTDTYNQFSSRIFRRNSIGDPIDPSHYNSGGLLSAMEERSKRESHFKKPPQPWRQGIVNFFKDLF